MEEDFSNSINDNSNMVNKVMGNITNWVMQTGSVKKPQLTPLNIKENIFTRIKK